MDLSRLDNEQTIVALSTPPPSADRLSLRCIVRMSGPQCRRIASGLIGPLAETDSAGFSIRTALLALGPSIRLPIEVGCFRAGHSYTGQEMIELHLPGSAALADQVVEALVRAGGRPAEPGEFTLRAVLSGRIDLTGAEAVAELIAARGDGQLRAAMQLADGRLARSVRQISERIVDLLAEVEAGLDFADEPLEFITPDRLRAGLVEARRQIGELAGNAGSFETLEHRATVALIGRPNAGKSTLLNRLTGVDRALCSPLPGTTRDVLTAPWSLPDGEVLLLDVAGLQSDGTSLSDPDALAQRAARRVAATADLLIVVLDAGDPLNLVDQLAVLDCPELAGRPRVAVCNKIDLAGEPGNPGNPSESKTPGLAWIVPPPSGFSPRPMGPFSAGAGILPVSARTGAGLDELKSAVNAHLFASAGGTARPGEQLMLNARHRTALAEADQALARAERLVGGEGQGAEAGTESGPRANRARLASGRLAVGDLVAQELREALNPVGQISGEVMTEDVLDRIFSRFCVGK